MTLTMIPAVVQKSVFTCMICGVRKEQLSKFISGIMIMIENQLDLFMLHCHCQGSDIYCNNCGTTLEMEILWGYQMTNKYFFFLSLNRFLHFICLRSFSVIKPPIIFKIFVNTNVLFNVYLKSSSFSANCFSLFVFEINDSVRLANWTLILMQRYYCNILIKFPPLLQDYSISAVKSYCW